MNGANAKWASAVVFISIAIVSISATSSLTSGAVRPGRPETAKITFGKEVSRILQAKCQSCHRSDGVAPFVLTNYSQVKAKAKTIRQAVESRRMPPWLADPKYGRFSNDRSLSLNERETLLSWLASGLPIGNEKDLPAPKEFPKGWVIGKPDLVLSMPTEYIVPAEGVLPYKEFLVDPGFNEDRWVQRSEAKPGCKAVHHILVYVQSPGKPKYDFQGNTPLLGGEAPGDMPTVLPEGMAVKVPAGAKLLFEIHYTPNGKVEHDRSSIGLIFAKQPPKTEVLTNILVKPGIKIPPNDPNHSEEQTFTFPTPIRIVSLMPHMHFRGKSWEYRILYADGRAETILSVPKYDFNWQSIYRFADPPLVPKGAKIHCIATWDNSKNNPFNPDPNKTVLWGLQTWDEMMNGWMGYIVENSKITQVN